ncbi:MAG: glycosyltransferase family 4 protein [Kofleriaceae bacterium]
MPRVLLTGFCAVPGPRRAGVQLRHVMRALTPMHNLDLLVVREGDQGYVERQGNVRILRVPAPETDLRTQIQSFQRALRRQLEGADYDVVHCRDAWSGLTVLEARERFGFTVVYDLTRSPLGESALDPELDAQYGRDEEACILAADVILAPSVEAAKALAGRGKPDRVHVAPPGVDVDRFDWEDPPAAGPPRIVYAGSIDPGRGVRVLIRAMAAIVREVDARLVIAGPVISQRFEQQLKEGIRELGLTEKVDLVGVVDHEQIPALLATATVCVVPAAADLTPNPTVVFPTKLLEYMACRRPIVAPRRETVAQVVENSREALLFEPGDPIDLARKVLRILGEPALGAHLATGAYERVRREFTASGARRAITKAYAVIAERFEQEVDDDSDEASPKLEIMPDDDFEATVFEEAPIPAPSVRSDDTALNRLDANALSETLSSLDHSTSSESVAAPPPPDDTLDRVPVAPPATPEVTLSKVLVDMDGETPAQPDDWVVTNAAKALTNPGSIITEIAAGELVIEAIDDIDTGAVAAVDEGTPSDGNVAIPGTPMIPTTENAFVAGEIDVPTPPPEKRNTDVQRTVEAPEFVAAGGLLGNSEDPDTGSRTPPLERRNP